MKIVMLHLSKKKVQVQDIQELQIGRLIQRKPQNYGLRPKTSYLELINIVRRNLG